MAKYIQIDNEGYFHFQGERLKDPKEGRELLKNFHKKEDSISLFTKLGETSVIVEAFDFPYLVQMVEPLEGFKWKAVLPYEYSFEFDVRELMLDEWDRFIGYAPNAVAFVFSRKAQTEFFNRLEEFEDESITWNGERIPIANFLEDEGKVNPANFWSDIYTKNEQDNTQPGWELSQAHPALAETLPQLKLPKCRVAVIGCGSGNDAAYFAEQGYVVTAFDISPKAIEQAQKKYSHPNITWVVADAFELGQKYQSQFDLVFEHTCFCAINPTRRSELVKVWSQILAPEGNFLGYFFVNEKRQGPPFGATEWEIKKRMESRFEALYWTRVKNEYDPWRLGSELCVFSRLGFDK